MTQLATVKKTSKAVTGRTGRPSRFTPELAEAVLAGIRDDVSTREVCRRCGIGQSTLFRWLTLHEDFQEQYRRAREDQGDMVVSKMIELEDALRDGQYDPHTVRTLIWSMQWRAAKLRPRVYGDNKRIEHDGEQRSLSVNMDMAAGQAIASDPRLRELAKLVAQRINEKSGEDGSSDGGGGEGRVEEGQG